MVAVNEEWIAISILRLIEMVSLNTQWQNRLSVSTIVDQNEAQRN